MALIETLGCLREESMWWHGGPRRRASSRVGFGFPGFGFYFHGPRPFLRRQEYIEMLEEYKRELEAELKEVEKELEEWKKGAGAE